MQNPFNSLKFLRKNYPQVTIVILSFELYLIDFMSIFYPYYFIVSPKIEGIAQIRWIFRLFNEIHPKIVPTPFLGVNWNMFYSVYFAHCLLILLISRIFSSCLWFIIFSRRILFCENLLSILKILN